MTASIRKFIVWAKTFAFNLVGTYVVIFLTGTTKSITCPKVFLVLPVAKPTPAKNNGTSVFKTKLTRFVAQNRS
jgi:hypothetical protein